MARKKDKPTDTHKGGVDDIADDLAQQSPQPSESFLAAQSEKQAEFDQSVAHLRDAKGSTFDKELHLIEDDGTPKLTGGGLLRRRRQRKSSTQTANEAGLTSDEQTKARMAGIFSANILFGAAVRMGGPEWTPVDDKETGINERGEMEKAFGDAFVAWGIVNFPPSVALIVAVGMYAAPRFTLPVTQSKLARASAATKKWFVNLGRKKRATSQPDSGGDIERKDKPGALASVSSPEAG